MNDGASKFRPAQAVAEKNIRVLNEEVTGQREALSNVSTLGFTVNALSTALLDSIGNVGDNVHLLDRAIVSAVRMKVETQADPEFPGKLLIFVQEDAVNSINRAFTHAGECDDLHRQFHQGSPDEIEQPPETSSRKVIPDDAFVVIGRMNGRSRPVLRPPVS